MVKEMDQPEPAVTEARAASVGLRFGQDGPETGARSLAAQQFSFDLDDDLAKLVTIRPLSGGMEVEVQYGRDYVLRLDRHVIRLARPPRITRTQLGVTIVTTGPLLPGVDWVQVQKTYRF